MAQGGGEVTKGEFLKWLNQFRYVGEIRDIVEQRIWGDAELDRLKKSLEDGGRLKMKTKSEERARIVRWF